MRLIDADALKERWTIASPEPYNTDAAEVLDSIDDTPTAYDIDKVVEWLEIEIEETKALGTDGMFRQGRKSGLMTAIRIVKEVRNRWLDT